LSLFHFIATTPKNAIALTKLFLSLTKNAIAPNKIILEPLSFHSDYTFKKKKRNVYSSTKANKYNFFEKEIDICQNSLMSDIKLSTTFINPHQLNGALRKFIVIKGPDSKTVPSNPEIIIFIKRFNN
jgi:hypothetical protein